MMTKYAIKVMLSKDDWIYVTKPDGNMFEVKPVLFNSRQEAEEFAQTWRIAGKEAFVKVVRYREK